MKASEAGIDSLKRQLEEINQSISRNGVADGPPLPPRVPTDTLGGMDDGWKASVEAQLKQLHGDVRSLLVAGITATVLVIGAAYAMSRETGSVLKDVQVQAGKTDTKVDMLLERTAPKK